MSELRNEVVVGATATGSAVVRTDTGSRSKQLIREFVTLPCLPQVAAEINYL